MLILLVLSVVIQECIGGGRHFIMTELKKSPLGLGARSAFRDYQRSSWRREASTILASNDVSSDEEILPDLLQYTVVRQNL